MLRPDNGALAEHPHTFEYVRSPLRTVLSAIVAVLCAVGVALVLVNFEAVTEWGESYRGRRQALAPYVGHIAVGLAAALGVSAGVSALTTGVWRLASGEKLSVRQWLLSGDPNEVYQRLATGDPRIYLPLPVNRRADSGRRLRVYTPRHRPVAYLTVTAGAGTKEHHWPLVTFEGPSRDAFEQVRKRLTKKYRD